MARYQYCLCKELPFNLQLPAFELLQNLLKSENQLTFYCGSQSKGQCNVTSGKVLLTLIMQCSFKFGHLFQRTLTENSTPQITEN